MQSPCVDCGQRFDEKYFTLHYCEDMALELVLPFGIVGMIFLLVWIITS
jgi:hypothetical protein